MLRQGCEHTRAVATIPSSLAILAFVTARQSLGRGFFNCCRQARAVRAGSDAGIRRGWRMRSLESAHRWHNGAKPRPNSGMGPLEDCTGARFKVAFTSQTTCMADGPGPEREVDS